MAEKEEIPDDFGEYTVSPQGNLGLSIPNVLHLVPLKTNIHFLLYGSQKICRKDKPYTAMQTISYLYTLARDQDYIG